jgi:hypothetical protein
MDTHAERRQPYSGEFWNNYPILKINIFINRIFAKGTGSDLQSGIIHQVLAVIITRVPSQLRIVILSLTGETCRPFVQGWIQTSRRIQAAISARVMLAFEGRGSVSG